MQDVHFGCRMGGTLGGPPAATTDRGPAVGGGGPQSTPPLRQQPTHLCKQSSMATCLAGGFLGGPPAATVGPRSVVAAGGLLGDPPCDNKQAHNTFCVFFSSAQQHFPPQRLVKQDQPHASLRRLHCNLPGRLAAASNMEQLGMAEQKIRNPTPSISISRSSSPANPVMNPMSHFQGPCIVRRETNVLSGHGTEIQFNDALAQAGATEAPCMAVSISPHASGTADARTPSRGTWPRTGPDIACRWPGMHSIRLHRNQISRMALLVASHAGPRGSKGNTPG